MGGGVGGVQSHNHVQPNFIVVKFGRVDVVVGVVTIFKPYGFVQPISKWITITIDKDNVKTPVIG